MGSPRSLVEFFFEIRPFEKGHSLIFLGSMRLSKAGGPLIQGFLLRGKGLEGYLRGYIACRG